MIINVSPPNYYEKFAYIDRYKWLLLGFGILSSLLLILSPIMITNIISVYTLIIFPYILFYTLYACNSTIINLSSNDFDLINHYIIKRKHLETHLNKKVDVFLPICGENTDIILNTWDNVKSIIWNNDLLNIYVLDDKKDDYWELKAKEYGFKYITRSNNHMKKAGNLLNAFNQTEGDFILVLDADFAPSPDILEELIPYMYKNDIGIVQSPQYFELNKKMTFIERGAAQIQEFFYRFVQVSRDTFGAPVCVGSCALYKRSALEKIGGPRQKEYSEDAWTGFTLLKNGFRTKYIPINLSKGRCPDTLPAFFVQQYRWARGALDLTTSNELWTSTLKFKQKLVFAMGFLFFSFTALSIPLFILPTPLLLNLNPEYLMIEHSVLFLPSLIFTVVFYLLWSHYKVFDVSFLSMKFVSYFAYLFALIDFIRGSAMAWVPTGGKINRQFRFMIYMFLAFCLPLLSLIGTFYGIYINYEILNINNIIIPVLITTMWNLLILRPVVYHTIIYINGSKK